MCDNALVLPIERVDRAVQDELATNVLRPAVVRAIIAGVFKALQPTAVTANVGALRTELRALDTKIANLTDAIENGAAVAPLVTKLQARQAERDDLLAAIGAAEAMKQIAVDRPTVECRVLEQVTKWQALLSANVADGRQALREVLDGPIRFAPDGKQYRFSGRDLTRQFIAGLVGVENSTLSGVPNGSARYVRTRTRRNVRVAARRHGPQSGVAVSSGSPLVRECIALRAILWTAR